MSIDFFMQVVPLQFKLSRHKCWVASGEGGSVIWGALSPTEVSANTTFTKQWALTGAHLLARQRTRYIRKTAFSSEDTYCVISLILLVCVSSLSFSLKCQANVLNCFKDEYSYQSKWWAGKNGLIHYLRRWWRINKIFFFFSNKWGKTQILSPECHLTHVNLQ